MQKYCLFVAEPFERKLQISWHFTPKYISQEISPMDMWKRHRSWLESVATDKIRKNLSIKINNENKRLLKKIRNHEPIWIQISKWRAKGEKAYPNNWRPTIIIKIIIDLGKNWLIQKLVGERLRIVFISYCCKKRAQILWLKNSTNRLFYNSVG